MSGKLANILYVEDHGDSIERATLGLTRDHYNVVAARSFDEAVELAHTRPFDLYLIDNWRIGRSGIELCKRLRQTDHLTPILFYSAAAYEYDKEEVFAAGADGYLSKPAFSPQLLNEVSRLTAKREARVP